MRFIFLISIIITLTACQNDPIPLKKEIREQFQNPDSIQSNIIDSSVIEIVKHSPSLYRPKDSSWYISPDIQEGYLLGCTLKRKNQKDTTIEIHNEFLIGTVDNPYPSYINDTTYFFPNAGSSSLGHFELYIYKNGTYKFVELVSPLLSNQKVDSIKNERVNPTPYKYLPKEKYVYSVKNEGILLYCKLTTYPDIYSTKDPSSNTFRLTIPNVENYFYFENDSLKNLEFFYAENQSHYYNYTSKLTTGFIKGIKTNNKTWLIEIDFQLELKRDSLRHLKIKKNFTSR